MQRAMTVVRGQESDETNGLRACRVARQVGDRNATAALGFVTQQCERMMRYVHAEELDLVPCTHERDVSRGAFVLLRYGPFACVRILEQRFVREGINPAG